MCNAQINDIYSFKCSILGCNNINLDYIEFYLISEQRKQTNRKTSLRRWKSYKIKQYHKKVLLQQRKIDNYYEQSHKRLSSNHNLISMKRIENSLIIITQINLNFIMNFLEESNIILSCKSISKLFSSNRYMVSILEEMNDKA